MAGDWIKMRVDLADDPAVIAIACKLGIDEYGVVGRLHKLWSWADKHCSHGHAKSVTFVWIDRYIGHAGFAESVHSEGWLQVGDGGVTFPKFDKHNGASAKSRAEAADRKRLERQMSQQYCDKTVTREEKRREEKKEDPLLVPVEPGDNQSIMVAKPDKPDCPHQKIIDLYHLTLPVCPQVREWTPARMKQLKARWDEDRRRQSLEYWKRFFEFVAGCDFLVGKSGRSPFFADLAWMTKQENFVKIIEGKYDNRL